MVTVEITRWPTGDARPRSVASPRCSGRSTTLASTPRIIIRKYRPARRARRRGGGRGAAPARRPRRAAHPSRAAGGPRRAHRLPRSRHRHDRRRARARLRRRDLARAAAERPLLARRPHRRRVALRARRGARSTPRRTSAGTSVYFPERALHMFPEELATGLCSLNPHVDRLVQSCLMEVDRHGQVVRSEFHDGVIHTDERMTYTDVNAILTGTSPETTAAVRAAGAAVRADARPVPGAERPPAAPRLDRLRPGRGGGRARTTTGRSRRSSRASGTSRTGSSRSSCCSPTRRWPSTSTRARCPALYRVHEEPDPLKVAQFEEFVSTLGLQPRGAAAHACGRATSRRWWSRSPARPRRSRSRS